MSESTKKQLLKLIEEYRDKAGEFESGSTAQTMHTAYAEGIRRAVTEIERESMIYAEYRMERVEEARRRWR